MLRNNGYGFLSTFKFLCGITSFENKAINTIVKEIAESKPIFISTTTIYKKQIPININEILHKRRPISLQIVIPLIRVDQRVYNSMRPFFDIGRGSDAHFNTTMITVTERIVN